MKKMTYNDEKYAVCKLDNKFFGDVVALHYPNGEQRMFYIDSGKWYLEYDKYVDNKQQLCVSEIDFFMEDSLIDEIDEIIPSVELKDHYYQYGVLCDLEYILFDFNGKHYAISCYKDGQRPTYYISEIDKAGRDFHSLDEGMDFFTTKIEAMIKFIKKIIIERVKKQ